MDHHPEFHYKGSVTFCNRTKNTEQQVAEDIDNLQRANHLQVYGTLRRTVAVTTSEIRFIKDLKTANMMEIRPWNCRVQAGE